jgi:photosystem II stability/assembly factor-like uncharacterized protein
MFNTMKTAIQTIISLALLFLCLGVTQSIAQAVKWTLSPPMKVEGVRFDTVKGGAFFLPIGMLGKKYVLLGRIRGNTFEKTELNTQTLILTSLNGYEWKLAKTDAPFETERSLDEAMGMYVYNDSTAIAMAGRSVFRTDDGGDTWRTLYRFGNATYPFNVFVPPSSTQNRMYMNNVTVSPVQYTSDLGTTWVNILPEQLANDPTRSEATRYARVSPMASDSMLYLTSYLLLYNPDIDSNGVCFYRSSNGGKTWDSLGTPIEKIGAYPDSIQIYYNFPEFATKNVGYMTCRRTDRKVYTTYICKTTDGGTSWKIVDESSYPESDNGINSLYLGKVFSEDTVVCYTGVYRIRVTYDGGKTWKDIINQWLTDPNNPAQVLSGLGGPTRMGTMQFTSPTTGYVMPRIGGNYGDMRYVFYNLENDKETSVTDDDEGVPTNKGTLQEGIRYIWLNGVHPQPAGDMITLSAYYESSKASRFDAGLYDVMGTKYKDYSQELQSMKPEGWFKLPLSTTGLSTGVYYLVVGNGREQYSIPICIVR